MERYKYRAINNKGRPIRGVISAQSEVDLYNQLQSAGLELIQCAPLNIEKNKSILDFMPVEKVKPRDLIQLFMHLEQMQSAGVPLLSALGDIRDTTDHVGLRDIMSEVHRDVTEGSSFSESLARHPKVFGNLYISLISSGEETGNLTSTYKQIIKYLKWLEGMQGKVRKATRYPMIVCGVVVMTVTVMMGFVVPQIADFIVNMDQELPGYTRALIAVSNFFSHYWWAMILVPLMIFVGIKFARKMSSDISYQLDLLALNAPIMGPVIRKINIARFSQTFGSLFASGIDVLRALEAARKTVDNLAMTEALEAVQEKVQTGSPLSEAFNGSGEFPSMVIRMLKVGEESGNLPAVMDQIAEFYTNDVDEAVQGLITMIEPFLTALLGGIILWIVVAVFGPIYSSFEDIQF